MDFIGFRNRRRKSSHEEEGDLMSGVTLSFCKIIEQLKGKKSGGILKTFSQLDKCDCEKTYRRRFKNSKKTKQETGSDGKDCEFVMDPEAPVFNPYFQQLLVYYNKSHNFGSNEMHLLPGLAQFGKNYKDTLINVKKGHFNGLDSKIKIAIYDLSNSHKILYSASFLWREFEKYVIIM